VLPHIPSTKENQKIISLLDLTHNFRNIIRQPPLKPTITLIPTQHQTSIMSLLRHLRRHQRYKHLIIPPQILIRRFLQSNPLLNRFQPLIQKSRNSYRQRINCAPQLLRASKHFIDPAKGRSGQGIDAAG